ncbi:hypothetical protein [Desulfitobacterium sp. AusDCA]|uniref:hypothetical protein n=1 Tax=Desulfitobacterium sp. AusDCA TaxID=3240383 RepID=UPI003DA70EF4
MSMLNPDITQPIKGGNSITRCLEETIAAYGYPFLFRSVFGLSMIVQTDDFGVTDYGCLNFYNGVSISISLSPSYIVLEPVNRPDGLVKDLKACFLIRQQRTKAVLGWLCWK